MEINYRANAKDFDGGANRPKRTQFGRSPTQNAVRKENAAEGFAETPPELKEMLLECGQAAL